MENENMGEVMTEETPVIEENQILKLNHMQRNMSSLIHSLNQILE